MTKLTIQNIRLINAYLQRVPLGYKEVERDIIMRKSQVLTNDQLHKFIMRKIGDESLGISNKHVESKRVCSIL